MPPTSFPPLDDLPDALTVPQLAELLHISARTIHNRRSLRPDSLPEATRLPGSRGLLFTKTKVVAWLASGGDEVQK